MDHVKVTKPVVLEIAKNLGVSDKLAAALVEKMWMENKHEGPHGFVAYPDLKNRDQVVWLVVENLKSLWG